MMLAARGEARAPASTATCAGWRRTSSSTFRSSASFTNRVGAVRACQENAERLLRHEALVAVFPEGVKGIGKLFKDRYRSSASGAAASSSSALRTGTPIVPVAVVGARGDQPDAPPHRVPHEGVRRPRISRSRRRSRSSARFGLAAGADEVEDPLGELIRYDEYGPEAADDELLVGRLAERVRSTIQGMLDRMLGERRSVWFG